MNSRTVSRVLEVISGTSMILVPIATMVAFAIHPQFWTFSRSPSAAAQYDYI
jgi:hypothetical protein